MDRTRIGPLRPGQNRTKYTYDCENRRLRKVVMNSGSLNGTTDFYYDGWRNLEERNGSDAVTNQYVFGNYLDEAWTLDDRRNGGTIASLNDGGGSQRHLYHCNTLYHVYGLTDEVGQLREAYEYDAYGRQTVITDGNDGDVIVNFNANDVRTLGGASTINGSPWMYTGQRLDETGLMYYKNRYFSQDLGRFISRDPAGSLVSESSYAYAGNDPSNALDPMGLQTLVCSQYSDPRCRKLCEDMLARALTLEQEGGGTIKDSVLEEMREELNRCSRLTYAQGCGRTIGFGSRHTTTRPVPVDPSKRSMAGLTVADYLKLPCNEWLNWWFSPVGSDKYAAAHGMPRTECLEQYKSMVQSGLVGAHVLAYAPIAIWLGGTTIPVAMEWVAPAIPVLKFIQKLQGRWKVIGFILIWGKDRMFRFMLDLDPRKWRHINIDLRWLREIIKLEPKLRLPPGQGGK